MIERLLNSHSSINQIAKELDRSPSTISREIKRNKTIGSPLSRQGERATEETMQDHLRQPNQLCGVCNGCKYAHVSCSSKIKVFYTARYAQRIAEENLKDSRRGIDNTEASVALKLSIISSDVPRGLSPAHISKTRSAELNLSRSTIYRWIENGYGDMKNIDLRRKVGYKPRKHRAAPKRSSHSARRSYAQFEKLSQDIRKRAWEMDTVPFLRILFLTNKVSKTEPLLFQSLLTPLFAMQSSYALQGLV